MWIRKFRAKNAGPLVDLNVNLTRGSIGIFGKNGVGKSSFLNFLYAAITNDFGRFAGVKADCVRNTAGAKEEAYVSVEMEHNDHLIKITRNLKPTKSRPGTELMVDEESAITDEPKARAKLNEVLGVDQRMLDLYVFKPQDRMYDFLTTTPAVRAKAYATLCRTEMCESAWNVLGSFLNTDTELHAEIIDNSDELQATVSAAKQQLQDINTKIQEQETLLLNDASLADAKEILNKEVRRIQFVREQTQAEAELPDFTSAVIKAEKKHNIATNDGKLLKTKLDGLKKPAESARVVLSNFSTYRKYRKQYETLRAERKALIIERDSKTKPVNSDKKFNGGKVQTQLADLERELKDAKNKLKVLDETGVTACPTCSTPVSGLKNHISSLREIVNTHPTKIKALGLRIEAALKYDKVARAYRSWFVDFRARVVAHRATLKSLVAVDMPKGDKKQLQKIVKEYETTETLVEAKRREWTKTQEVLAQRQADLKAKEKRIAEIKQGLTENTVAPGKLKTVQRRMDEHSQANATIAHLRGESKGLNQLIKDKGEQIDALRARMKRGKKLRRIAGIAEIARDVLHRDRLPRRVAQTNLSRMEGDINAGLELLGDPWWIESNEQLSFVVHKPGEPPQPADWLSTGQRVILAMAFWPAVASLWSADLGMLALDEPTANLDGDNRKLLGDALTVLTAQVRNRRQLLMVTHDRELQAGFDQVIDLDQPAGA